MLENLLTEQRNPKSAQIDTLPTEEILRVINDEDRKVADAVAAAIPQITKAVDGIVERFRSGGRLFYIGAGTSGRLGVLDASECPPTYGVSYEMVQGIIAGGESALTRATEASEDDPESGARDLIARGFTGRDTLVGIAASGRTPYVLGAIRKARELGGLTVGLACSPGSELAKASDIAIELIIGPEIVTGSTRMKAGTATKACAEHDNDGIDDQARICVWQSDGERPAQEREAARPGTPHCSRCVRRRRRDCGEASEPKRVMCGPRS